MKNIKFLFPVLFLCACVSVAKTKSDLKAENLKYGNIIINANYQELAKCWDDRAEKISVDFRNATASQIYPDVGLAELSATGAAGQYFILATLKKIGQNKTAVNIYGTDNLGAVYSEKWLDTLKKCAH